MSIYKKTAPAPVGVGCKVLCDVVVHAVMYEIWNEVNQLVGLPGKEVCDWRYLLSFRCLIDVL